MCRADSPLFAGDETATARVSTADEGLLAEQGIAPTREGVTAYLRRLRPDQSSAKKVAKLIEQLGNSNFGVREAATRDTLRWIDIERHPEERPEQHSTDFSDRAAQAALRAFRDRYRELLAHRAAGPIAEEDADLSARLRSLGYVDEGVGATERSLDSFELPPPGDSILEGS